MRILFDSKDLQYKSPFGTLTPGELCSFHIHIPVTVGTTGVRCILDRDGKGIREIPMSLSREKGAYQVYSCQFSLEDCDLYFYHFYIDAPTGGFPVFKDGDDVNMSYGELWQLSCVPADFETPDWAKGAVIYQLFPDRFRKSGDCDLWGKLEPYVVHQNWDEEVFWQPTPDGRVLNNDFYGGNFRGIIEKMDYIASLGTTILYLNPISKSFSSHRYDTGDYKTPDPMLGTVEDFRILCQAAHARGIRVILDGVYSHTGSDSLYFNREGHFPWEGAYNRQDSPYASWFTFYHWPDRYRAWWDFDTLPTVNKMDPAFIDYIITGEDSVVAYWLRQGADGFRLDVADELPDEFITLLRKRIREVKPDALLMGEVWEDASNKVAYDRRRRYFTDGELDSVMNYPFRTAIIDFVRGSDSGKGLKDAVMGIVENYPPQVLACNMNLLGTHDTPRILTALVDDFEGSREAMSRRHLSHNLLETAVDRFYTATFLQFTLPGSPSIYYGDEAGMEGHKDPFNRRPYPWGRQVPEFLAHFRRLGQLRKEHIALRLGDIHFTQAGEKHLAFTRCYGKEKLHIYINRSQDSWEIPTGKILLGYHLHIVAPQWLVVGARGFCITLEEA